MKRKKEFCVKITVLGSGTCAFSKERFHSSYFFYPNKLKENWLIDIGEGAIFRLLEAGESYKEIDRIFITHTHPDHIGALIPLLLGLNYTPGYTRKKPLFLYGPKTIKRYLKVNLKFAPYIKKDFPLEFIPLTPNKEIRIKECFLKVKKMKHFNPTFGYRWNFDECIIVYGGDGGFSKELILLSENADLLILECSFPKSNPTPGHLTSYEAGKIAKEANVKKLLLTHFYPEILKMEEKEIIGEIKLSGFEGEIILAKDLLSFKI